MGDKRSKRDEEIEQLKNETANVSRSFARLQKMMAQTCGASAAAGQEPVEEYHMTQGRNQINLAVTGGTMIWLR